MKSQQKETDYQNKGDDDNDDDDDDDGVVIYGGGGGETNSIDDDIIIDGRATKHTLLTPPGPAAAFRRERTADLAWYPDAAVRVASLVGADGSRRSATIALAQLLLQRHLVEHPGPVELARLAHHGAAHRLFALQTSAPRVAAPSRGSVVGVETFGASQLRPANGTRVLQAGVIVKAQVVVLLVDGG